MYLKTTHVVISAWAMSMTTMVAVSLRIWIRLTRGAKRLSTSDYIIGLCGALGPICSGITTKINQLNAKEINNADVQNGAISRLQLSKNETNFRGRLVIVVVLEYYILLWLLKAAFLAIYFELSYYLTKKLRHILIGIAVYCAVTFIVVMLSAILWHGRPFEALQQLSQFCHESDFKYCGYGDTLLIYFVCHISSDLMLMAFPLILLKKLKLCRREHWAMIVIVCFASLSIIIAMIRFAVLNKTMAQPEFGLHAHMWACVEEAVCVIASCLPAFRVFVRSQHEHTEQSKYSFGANLETFRQSYSGGPDSETSHIENEGV
ncbi:hypothetical protein EDC01DRAFT_71245 [Geopyxis carbonaria]|nr:hypothetical protein EDC01DRAFT_71245 [Geopyxis carbonaria]